MIEWSNAQIRPPTLLIMGLLLFAFGILLTYLGIRNEVTRTLIIGVVILVGGTGGLAGGLFLIAAERKKAAPGDKTTQVKLQSKKP